MGILTVNTDFEKLYGITEREYYSKQYLTFDISSLDVGDDIQITIGKNVGIERVKSISYSMNDGDTWTTVENKNNEEVTILIEKENDRQNKVLLKGDAVQFATTSTPNYDKKITISVENVYEVSGNILSLLYGDDFVGKSLPNYSYIFTRLFEGNGIISAKNLILPNNVASYCYAEMFKNCTSLATIPELPATTLAGSCYEGMFKNCTSLITAPELPATTLVSNVYRTMFYGCTSLTTAPELPATTLKDFCYANMFYGCTSLTTAPELPATTLAESCYEGMFNNCTNLNNVKCHLTGNINSDGTRDWLNNVAVNGTFYKDFSANYDNGTSGIPTGWTKIAIDLPTPTQTVNFVPNAGGVTEGDEVYLSASGKTTGIKFTTDGSNPTADSKTYEDGDVVIEEATTVKAAVFNADDVDFKMGPISTAEYTIITPSLVMYVDKFPPQGNTGVGDYDYEGSMGMSRAEYMQATAVDPEDYMSDKYVYYGQSVNIDDTTYYIWRGVGHYNSEFYLLTTTADYDTLSAQSIAVEGDVPFTSMYALATSEDGEFNVYDVTEDKTPRQLVKIEHYSDGE